METQKRAFSVELENDKAIHTNYDKWTGSGLWTVLKRVSGSINWTSDRQGGDCEGHGGSGGRMDSEFGNTTVFGNRQTSDSGGDGR